MTAKSQRWLISLIFLFSTVVESSNGLTPEDHYNLAKMAYSNNQCEDAIAHFEKYLESSEIETDKKNSIISAISWCRERLFEEKVEKATSFSGRPM